MKDKDDPETQKLLKHSKTKDILYERSLLSKNFLLFLKVLNITFILYIAISTIFYVCVHYYGKRVIQAKTLRVEYDNLLYQNLFVNFYFILITALGFITTKNKSTKYFAIYYSTLMMYSFLFLYAYMTSLNISHFQSNKFFWFSSLIVGITVIIFVVLVFYFFSVIHENKNYLRQHSTTNNVFHEICLRTDMMKFTFNHFLTKTKLLKFLPNLAFKKDSYYFTSLGSMTSNSNNETDKIDYLHTNFKKENNRRDGSNYSTEYSRRGLDSTSYKSPMSNTTASSVYGSYPKLVQSNCKVSYYKTDGSGRDSYITKNNGGFSGITETACRNFSSPKIFQADPTKKAAINCKVPIYKNNGFGRDTYISSSSGGFFNSNQSSHPSFFKSSLRNYEVIKATKKYDYIHYSQNFVKKVNVPSLNTMASNQRLLSARLSVSRTRFTTKAN